MYTIWSRFTGYIGPCLRWLYGSQRFPIQALQGGTGEVQGDIILAGSSPEIPKPWVKRTKLILTAASVVAVFVGWFLGRDPSQLQIVLPALVGSYCAADVGIEYVRNKYGNDSGTGTNSLSG
jgi:hypothetical protein